MHGVKNIFYFKKKHISVNSCTSSNKLRLLNTLYVLLFLSLISKSFDWNNLLCKNLMTVSDFLNWLSRRASYRDRICSFEILKSSLGKSLVQLNKSTRMNNTFDLVSVINWNNRSDIVLDKVWVRYKFR